MRKITNNNRLSIKAPDLVMEWHTTKNGDLTPYDIAFKSERIVWWKCSICGEEYEQRVCNRYRGYYKYGKSCKACSGKILTDQNRLSIKCPEAIEIWHPTLNYTLTPNDVSYGSHKIVWWKCDRCGKEYFMSVKSRTCNLDAFCTNCFSGKTSYEENQWIDSLNIINKNFEPIINNRIVCDGYDPLTNTIYEYNGSFWHGEPKYYLEDDINKITKFTFGKLYKDTLKRRELLLSFGYNVYEKWSESGIEIFFHGKGNKLRPKLSENIIIVDEAGDLAY